MSGSSFQAIGIRYLCQPFDIKQAFLAMKCVRLGHSTIGLNTTTLITLKTAVFALAEIDVKDSFLGPAVRALLAQW
jgi:hypothetical protein